MLHAFQITGNLPKKQSIHHFTDNFFSELQHTNVHVMMDTLVMDSFAPLSVTVTIYQNCVIRMQIVFQL